MIDDNDYIDDDVYIDQGGTCFKCLMPPLHEGVCLHPGVVSF